MLRYLRLYRAFVLFSFSRAFEFRFDFFFRVAMDSFWYAVQLAFFAVLFLHTPALGGWNLDQVLVFCAAYMFLDALHMTLFSDNTWWLPQYINKGDLDYYLVRPVSPLFFLSFRIFAVNSFLNLVCATGILIWALARYPEAIPLGNYLLFFTTLLMGNAIYFALVLVFLIPTFWLHRHSGLFEAFHQLSIFMTRPDRVFTGWMRRVLITVLPFSVVASFPTHFLFNGFEAWRFVHIVVVLVVMMAFMIWLWQRGLRAYSSASS